ncbi:hypothetical protein BZG36_01334 [Bifiguratus adelaidae]|uniref:Concentrative nucleoside transporter C-terminal domain-containing protein n=1 Tax=Bifiguratus adelaidae TaxID=1938954 RepID=A0A261Y534_9FUNG|nr:hypothetical protein BZG36_01334 [Bifiguratus adelaidae]
MTSGFATISGSVLFGYNHMGVNPQSLLTAAVMSIPCSLALSKVRVPDEEESGTKGKVVGSHRSEDGNVLAAAGNGASIGLAVACFMFAFILVIISLIETIDSMLPWYGGFYGLESLMVAEILGCVMMLVAVFIGIPSNGSRAYRLATRN